MKRLLIATLMTLTLAAANAQSVDVKDAWTRATVTGQKATGAFMKLTAKEGAKLVRVSSPAAGITEVHEMKMDGDVIKMRDVQGGLELPAGKTVELKPGGYHVMLMDLKAPLQKDSTVALTLVFQDAKGVESTMNLNLPVATAAPAAGVGHGAHKH